MSSKAQRKFNEEYLYVRKELVSGRNPFVTPKSLKDWIQTRVDSVVNQIVEERWKSVSQNVQAHADRELEIYHADLRFHGEKEDDDD